MFDIVLVLDVDGDEVTFHTVEYSFYKVTNWMWSVIVQNGYEDYKVKRVEIKHEERDY